MARAPKKPGAKPWSKKNPARRELSPDELWTAKLVKTIVESCHPPQRDAVEDPNRFATWLVGRGGGKTTAFKAKYLVGLAKIVRGRFVYVAPTLGMATELLWDPLKEACDQLGLRQGVDVEFKEMGKVLTFVRTGAKLRLFGGDDVRELNKLRGQPFDGVGGDEVAVWPIDLVELFVNRIIVPRLGERQGWIRLASTPGHVLRGLFYEATRPGSTLHRSYRDRKLVENKNWKGWWSHTWSLREVAELEDAAENWKGVVANWIAALETKERDGISDDNPVWMREYEGKWAQDDTTMVFQYKPHKDGKLWNRWEPLGKRRFPHSDAGAAVRALVEVLEKLRELHPEITDWRHVVTMDSGHADPFACNVLSFAPTDVRRRIKHTFAFEKVGMFVRSIAELLLGPELDVENPRGVFGVLGWPDGLVMDADQALLEELANVYGIRCVKAERKADYKFGAIELTNGDFFEGRIEIIGDTPLEAQLQELQWTHDDFSGRQREHKAQANHSSDTLIYGRRLIANMFEVGVAVAPDGGEGGAAPAAAHAAKRDPADLDTPERIGGEFGSLLSDGDYVDDWNVDSSDGGWGNNQ